MRIAVFLDSSLEWFGLSKSSPTFPECRDNELRTFVLEAVQLRPDMLDLLPVLACVECLQIQRSMLGTDDSKHS